MSDSKPKETGQGSMSPLLLNNKTKKAMESIAPILEGFSPKTSASENTSLKLPPPGSPHESHIDEDIGCDLNLDRTVSISSQLSSSSSRPGLSPTNSYDNIHPGGKLQRLKSNSNLGQSSTVASGNSALDFQHAAVESASNNDSGNETPTETPSSSANSSAGSSRKPSSNSGRPQLPKIGKIGVCAMDAKVLSKPCRHILNRLIQNGEFETIIFGDKVILDENNENWPTCDFLISFFSSGFPLSKAIDYVNLRKPFYINDLEMQKVLWDRRLCLKLLDVAKVPTPPRLEISRDGGPRVDPALRAKLLERGVEIKPVKEPAWKMVDDDTLEVKGRRMTKPFVEKPVDGEDHNIYIYYHSKNGGGGRRLFRKVGNKSSEFDPSLKSPRTDGSYIYEEFMDTDNFEDVKAYTVGEGFCHAETRKSPVVDGIVRRNTHGKEIRYVTELTPEEKEIARRVTKIFSQMICGFDLLRVNGNSYVIDVNGFSFVKDNSAYYDACAKILRETFIQAKKKMDLEKRNLPIIKEEKTQKWVFKGLVTVIRHADRTPKQKFKHSFRSPIFISLLKGHKEEVVIRNVNDLKVVLQALTIAQEENTEDPQKLKVLANALEKKMDLPGTKIQLKPVLNSEKEVEKVQFILKWGGEPTHSARYQATELGEQMRQDFDLLNKNILPNIKIFSSSERRVLASAQLWAMALFGADELGSDEISIRKDLLDDSNAAKDLMDNVKKQLKPLLREGKEAPRQFAWPAKMPEPYLVIKRVVELMNYHKHVMDYNFETKDVADMQRRWCCAEDPMLFKERWDKLFKEFVSVEKVDPAKISELYDTMKYDALHNRQFLEHIFASSGRAARANVDLCKDSLVDRYPINILAMNNFKIPDSSSQHGGTSSKGSSVGSLGWVLESSANTSRPSSQFDDPKFMQLRELYKLSKVLFDFICPQEYGIEDNEKLDIGLLTSLPLAKQILNDIDDMKKKDAPACVAYFTKESHIYTLLNIIYESGLPMRIARNALPELDYLSQINFELYESTDNSGQKAHSLRLKMSPGCHTQDPLEVQLDEKHYISCIPKISLTKHLDLDYVSQKLRNKFSRVILPKKFTPVNITSPNLTFRKGPLFESSSHPAQK
ncbi:inositol polyphosphate kinase VIP1 [Lachancea thermotolerans CBS 6340]|uniref:Inositol hexakisphosphate and diphosphoinositol-pentakisphosphate kinase n=1 Tax=Lachancea thermotolerans (strain ATCC 56472 / CBS 6340 / NRRL Y-8284) TaxID=559295 RepID=C5DFG8_LACTC|nr:KLTH0D14982p [Lachancea thermotolerans CBS 6340]CAR22923.1 KLTH0D14982p [Lachancea thermotolerans CBS 6340]